MSPQVTDIMTSTVKTVRPGDSLNEAYLKMTGFRHLPVLDNDSGIVGIISDRDFQRALVPNESGVGKPKFKQGATVEQYMSWPVATVDAKTQFLKVVELMISKKISAVLVTDAKELIGIVTSEDLMFVLAEILKQKRSYKEQIFEKLNEWGYHSPIGQIVKLLAESGI
jgi:CBS domain-containing protein